MSLDEQPAPQPRQRPLSQSSEPDFQVIIPLAMLDFYQCALVELKEVSLSESKENIYSEDISSLLSEMSKVRVKRVQRVKSILMAVKG